MVTRVAYQLTVTRRGAVPGLRGSSANGWELSIVGFNGQKRSKISAIATDTTAQRYGGGQGLVNGGHRSAVR